jgi:hypothetical protein
MNTLGNVLVNLDGVLCAHLALRVGRGPVVVCLEKVKILQPFSYQRPDVKLRACGDGSDQAGRSGRAQGIAVSTFKPDPGEMRRV